MKKILLFAFFAITTQLSAQRLPINQLYKSTASEFSYSGWWPYWAVTLTVNESKDTAYHLVAFDNDGEKQFTLKLDNVKYCPICEEIECEYSGMKFSVFNPVKN